jgi:hypothetical protein
LAAGHGFLWEEGRDYQLAKDVAAECRAGRKRQPQAGRFLADPAVVGRARRDAAAWAQRRAYLGRLGAKAVRVELAELVWKRMVPEAGAQPERLDVGLVERQWAVLTELPAQSPVWAVRLAQKRLAMVAFEPQELVAE